MRARAIKSTPASTLDEISVATAPPPSTPPDPMLRHRYQLLARVLPRLSEGWILLVLVALVASFAIASPNFLTIFNVRNILIVASIFAIMATGQTLVIITTGIDLSVGSILVFSGVAAAIVMGRLGGTNANGFGIAIGWAAGLASGLAWGLVNGWLVARSRVPALIVTLGTYGMAFGLAEIMTGGYDLNTVPAGFVSSVGEGRLFGIPALVIAAVVVAAAMFLLLSQTSFGRHTYAVGSNREAARRAGVKTTRIIILVYALQGLLAGLAGLLSLAFFASTTISGHGTDNLTVISGVVLGGTSLFGGYGTIGGSMVGILIPVVLQNGLVIVGVQAYWQTVAIGAILILAVYIDQRRRTSRERRTRPLPGWVHLGRARADTREGNDA